ncbi:hypothetical protein [Streptomyces lunaelactis]|uniref:hypothetical protein n=1 Tax=Streptomyces lunaelactis TaxID=1535768 RepID=UPI0020C7BC4A|nr:hypothetical protein [Streptomyces lunaelactis]
MAEGEADTEGDAESGPDGVRTGLGEVLGLGLRDGRPGRGRPSPAGRPAREGETLGVAVGEGAGSSDSSAYAWGTATSRSDATVIAH